MELSLGVNIESSYFEEQKVEQGRNNGTKRGRRGDESVGWDMDE